VTKKPGTLLVRFNPQAIGTRRATLVIASSDPNENPFTIGLIGTGLAPEIEVSFAGVDLADNSPTPLDFGTVIKGNSAVMSFTLRNSGNSQLKGLGVKFSGGNAKDFKVTKPLPKFIDGGKNVSFEVTFKPAAPGMRTTSMDILSNDADEKPFDISLAGTCSETQAGTLLSDGFESAVSMADLRGNEAASDAIPHGDGLSNLLKYAFNLDLSRADRRTLVAGTGISGLPVLTAGSEGNPVRRLEYLRRAGSELVYTPEVSSDLETWSPLAELPRVQRIDERWERVIHTLQGSDGARFIRVEVSRP
jgi:hypothetical protein